MSDDPRRQTKIRILDAAERLFSEKGFGSASLRDITTAAGVNLAAVNYHFQSKDTLAKAVISRRIGPINTERLRMLEEAEIKAAGAPIRIEAVLEALYGPALGLHGRSEPHLQTLVGHIWAEPGSARDCFLDLMMPIAERFAVALRPSLPSMSDEDFCWRMHFVISVLAFTMAGLSALERISGGRCTIKDPKAAMHQMVQFASAGLRAPRTEEA